MVTTSQRLFKKYPKSATPLKIIMLIRLFFGIYFNFHSSKIISTLTKLYCLGVAIGLFIVNIIEPEMLFMATGSITEYCLYIIFHLYTANEFFFEYCSNLKINDSIIGFKNTKLVTIDVIAAIMIALITRIVMFIISVFYIPVSLVSLVITAFIMSSLSCSYLTKIMFFGLLRNRIVLLRKSLENCQVPVNIINETAKHTKEFRKVLYYYNNLFENIKNADKNIQFMLTVAFGINFPNVLLSLYFSLMSYSIGINMPLTLALGIELMQMIVLIFIPALICELIYKEVNNIKNILQKQLLQCSDELLRFELETALDYVTRRPIRFGICRVFSLDLSLVVGFLSTCITYVIVLVQFTFIPS